MGICAPKVLNVSAVGHQLRNRHIEGGCDHFQVADTDFLLPIFEVGNEAAVHPDVFGHVELRPAPAYDRLDDGGYGSAFFQDPIAPKPLSRSAGSSLKFGNIIAAESGSGQWFVCGTVVSRLLPRR